MERSAITTAMEFAAWVNNQAQVYSLARESGRHGTAREKKQEIRAILRIVRENLDYVEEFVERNGEGVQAAG